MAPQLSVTPGDPGAAARAARTNVREQQLLAAAARLMERDGSHAVSMQALAEEASVSVGLIYRYFDNKQDLLLAVIVQVLDAFAAEVPQALQAAGEDPVERVAAAFAAYCTVIDEHRHAAVLSYRESKTLGEEGRRRIKDLEIETSGPLRLAVQDAVDAGRFVPTDVDLFAYNLLLLAHSWALKHWYFERSLTFSAYVRKQTALALSAVVAPEYRSEYAHLLDPS